MTQAELTVLREKILTQMARPLSLNAGDKGMTNRSLLDLEKALAKIDVEIASLSGSTLTRCTYATFSKG